MHINVKTYTKEEFDKAVQVLATYKNMDRDNEGQLILYTGVYEWSDGTLNEEPDPTT